MTVTADRLLATTTTATTDAVEDTTTDATTTAEEGEGEELGTMTAGTMIGGSVIMNDDTRFNDLATQDLLFITAAPEDNEDTTGLVKACRPEFFSGFMVIFHFLPFQNQRCLSSLIAS